MIPFKGTKWNYSSSNETSIPPSLRNTVDNSGLMERKASKMIPIEPLDLMNKLEKFSDVWNDCPTIDNSVRQNDYRSEDKRRSYNDYNVSEANNKIIHNTSYPLIKADQLNLNGEERKKNKKDDKNSRLNNQTSRFPSTKTNQPVLENDSSKPTPSKSGKYDAKKADLKRKKAVLEQQQLHVDQKNIIKQALSSLVSCKIIEFDE